MSSEQHEHDVDALEETEDARAFDAAMAEEGANVPWKQALADLGWSDLKT